MSWTVAADIAARIRELRAGLGGGPETPVPQAELARRAGVRASQVSQWERGLQRPSRSRLERWAEREGWPIAMFEEGAPRPEEILAGGRWPAPVREAKASPGGSVPVSPAEDSLDGPEEILARFYQLMADAAAGGRPMPPEAARLMDAMYHHASGVRQQVPEW